VLGMALFFFNLIKIHRTEMQFPASEGQNICSIYSLTVQNALFISAVFMLLGEFNAFSP